MYQLTLKFFFSNLLIVVSLGLFSQELRSVYPKRAQVVCEDSLLIQWNEKLHAKEYTVFIGTTDDYTILDSFKLENNSLVFFPDTNVNTHYYYFVRTKENSSFIYSDSSNFVYFNPKNVNGLAAWTMADRGVDTVNSKVREWKDQSGNARHLSMSTISKQPLFLDSSLNLLPSIYFDEMDDGLLSPVSIDSNDYLMSILYNCKDLGNDIRRSIHGSNNWLLGKYATAYNVFAGGFTGGLTFVPNKFIVQSAKYTNGVLANYINGSFIGDISTSVVPGKIGLGSWSGSNKTNGNITEFLVYKSTVNDSLQYLIERYLMDKYAPPINLGEDLLVCSFPVQINAYHNYLKEYKWSDNSTDSVLYANTEGYYKLTATDIFDRTFVDSIYIKLDTVDSTVQLIKDTTICKGEQLLLHAGPDRYSYSWNTGDNSSYIQIDSSGTYIVNSTNCLLNTSSDTFYLKVNHPEFSLGKDSSICFYNSLVLAADSNFTSGFQWSTGASSPTITVDSAGLYSLIVTDAANCSFSDSILLSVDSTLFDVGLTEDTALCEGNSISVQKHNPQFTYLWSDGSMGSSLVVNSSKIYSLKVSYNNCSIVDSISIFIKGLAPEVDFSVKNLCFGDTVLFEDASKSLDSSNIVGWQWDFGDGGFSNDRDPLHFYSMLDSFSVSLNVQTDSFCTAGIAKKIYVKEKPTANFSFGLACEGSTVGFEDASSMTLDSIIAYKWNFGNNDSMFLEVKNPDYLYDSAASYAVQLEVLSASQCRDTLIKYIQVHPAPQISYTISGNCLGDSTRFLNATSVDTGSIVKYEWNLGNGYSSNKRNPVTLYTESKAYEFFYRATTDKNCQMTVRDTFHMNSLPTADFIGTDFCLGEDIVVNNLSTVRNDSIKSFVFIFNQSDSSALNQAIFSSQGIGAYPLSLYVETYSGCVDSMQKSINVHPNPTAAFKILNNFSGAPLRLEIQNNSTGADQYIWDFGNGDSSYLKNPEYIFRDTGTYSIQLKAISAYSCVDSSSQILHVKEDFLDAYLMDFDLSRNNGYLVASGHILNSGTSTIENMQLILSNSDLGMRLLHNIIDTLHAGDMLSFELEDLLQESQKIDFLCMEIIEVNGRGDEVLANNRICHQTFNNKMSSLLSPNPVNSELKLEIFIPPNGTVQLSMYDYSGRKIQQEDEVLSNNSFIHKTYLFDVSHLPTGIYFFRIIYNGEISTEPFIKY